MDGDMDAQAFRKPAVPAGGLWPHIQAEAAAAVQAEPLLGALIHAGLLHLGMNMLLLPVDFSGKFLPVVVVHVQIGDESRRKATRDSLLGYSGRAAPANNTSSPRARNHWNRSW